VATVGGHQQDSLRRAVGRWRLEHQGLVVWTGHFPTGLLKFLNVAHGQCVGNGRFRKLGGHRGVAAVQLGFERGVFVLEVTDTARNPHVHRHRENHQHHSGGRGSRYQNTQGPAVHQPIEEGRSGTGRSRRHQLGFPLKLRLGLGLL